MKRSFLLIMLICLSFFAVRGEEPSYGVLFHSSADLIDQRTSLNLFAHKPVQASDKFSISFDLSIRDVRQFGYILRLVTEEGKEVSLVFVNFRGEDNLFLDLNSSISNQSVQIPVDKQMLDEQTWLPLRLYFDTVEDRVDCYLRNQHYTFSNVGISPSDRFFLVFGLHGLNLDVPRMAIRHIELTGVNRTSYRFPLNETEGEWVHDSRDRVLGEVKNPEWIINRHHSWKEETRFFADVNAGIAYDPTRREVQVINRDSIVLFNPQYNQSETVHFRRPLPFTIYSGEAVYSPRRDNIFIYNLGQGHNVPSMAIIDRKDWSMEIQSLEMPNPQHHHNAFLGIEGLQFFGGYGIYSYSNTVYLFDQEAQAWTALETLGDTIAPRFFSAVGNGILPTQKLIFGGFGNLSGRQEQGGRNLYDLYSYDTRTRTFTKLWEITVEGEPFTPCNNLVLNNEKTHFYTICYPHHLPASDMKLYRFSLADGSYEEVSSALPIVSEKINTRVYLFFDHSIEEFYAVVREYIDDQTSEVRVYSLFSPPISEQLLSSVHEEKGLLEHLWTIIFILLAVPVVIALFVQHQKQAISSGNTAPKSEDETNADTTAQVPDVKVKNNAIYTFGEFLAFDREGRDISYRFSTRLRTLFALILIHSDREENYVSTEEMTALLWPDRDPVKAKNNRGVNINHLRNILSDMDGIELIHKNSHWFFAFEQAFYCDFIVVSKSFNPTPPVSEETLFDLTNRGPLFPDIQTEWMDEFRKSH